MSYVVARYDLLEIHVFFLYVHFTQFFDESINALLKKINN